MVATTREAPPSVNVQVIDGQHAVLLECFERLEQALLAGKCADTVPQLLRELNEYAQHHLPTEERLMESLGYPLRDVHTIEHRRGQRRLMEIERMIAEGHPAAAMAMLSRLRAWCQSHVTDWDAKLGEFLNSRGLG